MAIWSGIYVPAVLTLLSTGTHAQQNVCGRAPLNNKIVGGQEAADGSWPWQASLQFKGWHACGGSLINDKWVLSAAHCFFSNRNTTDWRVYLGRRTQVSSNPNGVLRRMNTIVLHPDFNPTTLDNDMVLLELNSTVRFTNYILPICLASAGSTFNNGTDSWVTGFGTLSEDGNVASTLQEVDVPVIGNKQCDCLNANASITSNMICAGVLEGGKDSCQGDSGGPMVHKLGSLWVQSGVVSFGFGCARPGFPGVYARVSRYQSWITSTVGSNLPGFIRFTSTGTDSDNSFTCSTTSKASHPLSFSSLVLFPLVLGFLFTWSG